MDDKWKKNNCTDYAEELCAINWLKSGIKVKSTASVLRVDKSIVGDWKKKEKKKRAEIGKWNGAQTSGMEWKIRKLYWNIQ